MTPRPIVVKRLADLAVIALAFAHGFARALLVVAVLALCGCPKLPPVSGCTPASQSCRDGVPHVCSATQRWEPAGDTSCAAVGGVCVVGDSGLAHCATVSDGGSP